MPVPIARYAKGFINLFYPRCCASCGNVLYRNEKVLCLPCYCDLPKTDFHLDPENEVARLFWGRIPVANATSFIYFSKGSRYRQILHELKYNGQQEVGLEMGRLFGLELRGSDFATADMIHPLPLHRKRLRKRGYNQSELIARGMAEVLQIPVKTTLVQRVADSPSQTRKTRYERWENVKDIFVIKEPEAIRNKHVLLVDDVITTGATMEACGTVLLAQQGVKLSVAALACAKLQ